MHLVRKKGEVGSWGVVSKALLSFLNSSLNCNVKDFESIKNNYEYQKKNPEDNIRKCDGVPILLFKFFYVIFLTYIYLDWYNEFIEKLRKIIPWVASSCL